MRWMYNCNSRIGRVRDSHGGRWSTYHRTRTAHQYEASHAIAVRITELHIAMLPICDGWRVGRQRSDTHVELGHVDSTVMGSRLPFMCAVERVVIQFSHDNLPSLSGVLHWIVGHTHIG